jgi:glycerol-3-phosphate dehydrogenase
MVGRLKADVVVIGAGITGASIARELSRYELKVFLVEKEADVACGSTKANTAIVHAGYDAQPGTWKAKLNVRGVNSFFPMCQELGVRFEKTGTLVVALDEEQLPKLYELLERGYTNDVRDLEIIGRDEVLSREPNINPKAIAALWAPTAGITCPWELTIALVENAVNNGVTLLLNSPVLGIDASDCGSAMCVKTPGVYIETRYVVNAGGLYSDDIARMVGQDDFRIAPRKGEYYVYDKRFGSMVSCPIFPVPTAVSKGILVTNTIDGNLMIGPNAQDLNDKEDLATSWTGLSDVLTEALMMVPGLPMADSITNFAGLRAIAKPSNDFVLGPVPGVPRFINAAGIQSPGLTAAPAVAEVVRDFLYDADLDLVEKSTFNPCGSPRLRFSALSRNEQGVLIDKDPNYGQIVCRCETVTEAEILAAIHGPIPCTTMDGVKRRTRAGMGRCQAGFCTPRVAAVLGRELGCDLDEVTKRGSSTGLLLARTCDLRAAQGGDDNAED